MPAELLTISCSYVCSEETRLDVFVQQILEFTLKNQAPSRSQVKLLIEDSKVLVNQNKVKKAGSKVVYKDLITVSYTMRASELEPYDFKLNVLFEDDYLIVIDKPAGLSMHPGAGNASTTVANALISHFDQSDFEGSSRPGIVHRLDKDTSGVVVAAKKPHILAALQKQFANREVLRSYTGLAFSTPRGKRIFDKSERGQIDAPIGRDPRHKTRMAVLKENGKAARTNWQVLERFAYAVLLEFKLDTGRTHQIRVHAAYVGSPLIGDPLYFEGLSFPESLSLAAKSFGRQALHAGLLGFRHPETAAEITFQSDPPKDLLDLIEAFRGLGA